jgi:hypothetical protein
MVPGGYRTSSNTVRRLIDIDGLESFELICILTEAECMMSVYDFETRFLQEYCIAQNPHWLNLHNNTNWTENSTFGTDGFKQKMQAKYGVSHNSHIPAVIEKRKTTQLANFGETCWKKNPALQRAFEDSMMLRYGVKNVRSLDSTKAAIRATMLTRYGVENYNLSAELRAKSSATLMRRTGYDHNTKDPAVIARRTARYLEKTGYSSPMENPVILAKKLQTLESKYGNSNLSAIPEVIAKKVAIQKAKRERPMTKAIHKYLTEHKLTPKILGISVGYLRFNDLKLTNLYNELTEAGHHIPLI